MAFQAVKWGAKSVVGIDYDRLAIRRARSLASNEPVAFSCEDIESPACWRSLGQADVVLFLAVYLTREIKTKEAVLSNAASKADKVMYVEGHEGNAHGYTPDRYVADLVRYTDFENVEFLGRLRGAGARPLFRCWRGALTPEDAVRRLRQIVAKGDCDRIVVVGKSAVGKTRMRHAFAGDHLGEHRIYDDVKPPYVSKKFILFDWRGLEYVPDAQAVFFLVCDEAQRVSRIASTQTWKDRLLRSPPGDVSHARLVLTVNTGGMVGATSSWIGRTGPSPAPAAP